MDSFAVEEDEDNADEYERWKREMNLKTPDGNGYGEELLR